MKILAKQFIQLRPDEHYRLTVREYFITRVPLLTIVSLAYLTWWFFFYIFMSWGVGGTLGWVVVFLVIVAYGARIWLIWKNDCCVITDRRLIDVAKQGAFITTVREVMWPMVYDVQYTQRGFWATVCGYGAVTVFVRDAQPVVLQHVYQPAIIRDILSEYVPTLH